MNDEQKLNYAWQWFKYHADQRLRAFHFFLLIIAALFGWYKVDNENIFFISLVGLLVSLIFFFMDLRNERLVNDGKDELSIIEENNGINIVKRDELRYKISSYCLYRHTYLLKYVISFVGIILFWLSLKNLNCNIFHKIIWLAIVVIIIISSGINYFIFIRPKIKNSK